MDVLKGSIQETRITERSFHYIDMMEIIIVNVFNDSIIFFVLQVDFVFLEESHLKRGSLGKS